MNDAQKEIWSARRVKRERGTEAEKEREREKEESDVPAVARMARVWVVMSAPGGVPLCACREN